MTEKDFNVFAGLLKATGEVYGKSLSDGVITVYWNILKQFDFNLVKQAFNSHLQNPDSGKFMPKPADLIERINGNSQDRAFMAITKIEKAIARVGVWQSVVFDDWIIHRVIEDVGGWIAVCSKTAKEWEFLRNELAKRYRYYANATQAYPYCAKLIGVCDAQNAQKGYPEATPCFFGDERKAKAVMASAGRDKGVLKLLDSLKATG